MIFTQEQINEIRKRLAIAGSKDYKLPLAALPLQGNEIIAITQNGENKRMSIEEFYNEFAQYIDRSERVDFFNVSRYAQQISEASESIILSLEEAVDLCPNDVRRGGQVITFINRENKWVVWQYTGVTSADWTDTDHSWINISSTTASGISFTISKHSIDIGDTETIHLHFETLDGEKASSVQLLINGVVDSSYTNISYFDIDRTVSDETVFTVQAVQYGNTYEKSETVSINYSAWIGAGNVYTDAMIDTYKIDITGEISGSYDVVFTSTAYFMMILPETITVQSVTMNGFEVPMQTTYDIEIGDLTYTVHTSSNKYVAGTQTFNIETRNA